MTTDTGIDARLSKCFLAVFPKLPPAEIQAAALESVEAWDSIATATLLDVISEEFSTEIDFGEADSLTSYSSIRAYLLAR